MINPSAHIMSRLYFDFCCISIQKTSTDCIANPCWECHCAKICNIYFLVVAKAEYVPNTTKNNPTKSTDKLTINSTIGHRPESCCFRRNCKIQRAGATKAINEEAKAPTKSRMVVIDVNTTAMKTINAPC